MAKSRTFKKKEALHTFSMRIPESILLTLDAYCRKTVRGRSQVITRLIETFLRSPEEFITD